MSEMIWAGASWSGRERHCVYLNCGDGSFVNYRSSSGMDFLDDGRALAVVDWDSDGDSDLWLKNRTGPQLRFMRNNQENRSFVSFTLIGTKTNRDAVGARMTIRSGETVLGKTVTAGSGYMAQSSKRLVFGFKKGQIVKEAEIRWPDGTRETLSIPRMNRNYRYLQGSGSLDELGSRTVDLHDPTPRGEEAISSIARIVLREPVPLPEDLLNEMQVSDHKNRLITFWANWCPNCLAELKQFSKHKSRLESLDLAIVPLSLDRTEEDQLKAQRVSKRNKLAFPVQFVSESQMSLFSSLLKEVLDIHNEMVVPMSFLIDSEQRLRMIYSGEVPVLQLEQDLEHLQRNSLNGNAADQETSGRWYSLESRSFGTLVTDLKQARLIKWARFYLNLERQRNAP